MIAPKNLQIIRNEADKVTVKWSPIASQTPIKAYRIYFSEYQPQQQAKYEWKPVDKLMNENTQTEITIQELNVNKDYAFKIAAIDISNNEGSESEIQIVSKVSSGSGTNTASKTQQATTKKYQYNEQIGMPRDVNIEFQSSTSVKFEWLPPANSQLSSKIQISFLISYLDRVKSYKDIDGKIKTSSSGSAMYVSVPGLKEPTKKMSWLVTGLEPDTVYDFNISAVIDDKSQSNQQGPPVTKTLRTKRDKPLYVDKSIIKEIFEDNTVLIQLGNASERHGPISYYWLVNVPNNELNKYQETYERDLTQLIKVSLGSSSQQLLSNETAYITAEFEASKWLTTFTIGDGQFYGRFNNRLLQRGIDYKIYTIAFTDDLPSSSAGSSNKLNILSSIDNSNSESANQRSQTITNRLIIGDLYSASQYSDIYNTKPIESKPIVHSNDFQNLLWIAGAISGFMFILVLIGFTSFFFMRRKRKSLTTSNTRSTNNCGLNVGTLNSSNGCMNSNPLTSNNHLNSNNTNTFQNTRNSNNNNNNHHASHHQHQTIITTTAATSTALSSSSPITTTTQLLLNSNQQIINSNSSSSTTGVTTATTLSTTVNNTNTISKNANNSLGLLTTVTPIHHHHHQSNHTPTHPFNTNNNESLYTSIDASQRQHLLSNYQNHSNTLQHPHHYNIQQNHHSHAYSHSNNHATNHHNHNGYNTLSTTHQQHHLSSYDNNTFVNGNGSGGGNYDPIEMRRLQFQTIGMQTHPPIKVEDLTAYIEQQKMNNNEKFSIEYESIEPGQQFTWENSTLDYNRQKNRYANVIAYDNSRVILSQLYEQPQLLGSDYINANYIDGYRKRNAYIATQGPLPSTYGDFWRMIWEQNTYTIVMMTKLEERNRLKCDQYWPSKGSEIYGNVMQVSLIDYTELSTYSIRTLIISRLNTTNTNEIKREVKLFQFTAWPDNGVPEHPTSLLMFIKRVHRMNPSESGPIVVHCSAGVGRTGCYIVIDSMIERLKYEKTIDIYGHVTCLRSQRNYMVQTEEQYIFCYDTILEAIQSGQTDIKVNNLYQHLERLLQTIDENCTLTEMELEYKRLANAKAPQSKFQSANMAANKFKNRLVNILPYESTRVCLSMLPISCVSQTTPQHNSNNVNLLNNSNFIEGSDYINANFIDGYKYKRAYIATQAPLNETIDDFWRMLWEQNSTIIVMLTKLREMGREKCAQYWPSERSIRYQYFVVDPIAEYNMSQYILREFKVTDARDGQSRTIRQFQYIDWPEQGVPKSGESIIELIGQVHKTKEQFGQIGPITVHCSAGVGRTGVFITLSIVLERMRYEGMVDVFNTVKMLRTQRPAMVQTEDQYQFCYRAALEYLGSFDNYET